MYKRNEKHPCLNYDLARTCIKTILRAMDHDGGKITVYQTISRRNSDTIVKYSSAAINMTIHIDNAVGKDFLDACYWNLHVVTESIVGRYFCTEFVKHDARKEANE